MSASSIEQRRAELAAKRERLLELKRQNKERQHEFSRNRQSIGGVPEVSNSPNRAESRKDINEFINKLVGEDRPNGSRPASVSGSEIKEASSPGQTSPRPSIATQTLSTTFATIYDVPPSPVKEVVTYSKQVQTVDWPPARPRTPLSESDEEPLSPSLPRSARRKSKRQRQTEEEIRESLRKEIEAELQTIQKDEVPADTSFSARALTGEELQAITASDDFMDFIDRSTKVMERALDEQYDVLADYAYGASEVDEEDGTSARGSRRVKEIVQFWDERWSKKRIISAVGFSPKFPELVLAAYTKNPSAPHDPDGLVKVWNMHLKDRPEYIFHAQSDVLTAKFSPFHPNLIVGGAYSGQVLLWDTRAKSAPVQKTPLTGSGHTHPVYSVDIVGTQNANNIISCSTDGVVCGWTVDMLAQPQEYLELATPPPAKTEDLSPTCLAFPHSDPTYFLVGTEEGTIYPCHRYDRAGAKAGVEQRINYKGHAAPVMSLSFHPARGQVDLSDLVLSASLDWSVKLWKARAPATTGNGPQEAKPLLDLVREDVVYDVAWSPVKPGVFSLVDGGGNLEIWDITVDSEVPLARVSPSQRRNASVLLKSLNKVSWEEHDGKRLATGGLDGQLTVFEVGSGLGGKENVRGDEWNLVKKLVGKLGDGGLLNGSHV